MMKPAERDREFVADLSADRARLHEAKVMRFRGRAAAHHARLRGDEFAVLLVAQTNGLARDAAAANSGRFGRGRHGSVEDLALQTRGLIARNVASLRRRVFRFSSLDLGTPLSKGGLNEFGVGEGQRILSG